MKKQALTPKRSPNSCGDPSLFFIPHSTIQEYRRQRETLASCLLRECCTA